MMDFLKKFFEDDKTVIGLCAFNKKGRSLNLNKAEIYFYKDFNKNRFVPRMDKNILLV